MDSRRMVTVRVRIGIRRNFTRGASQSHSAICGNAARSCRFYIYHMTDLFSSRLPPDSESELHREREKEEKRKRETENRAIRAPGISLHYEISLASRKSSHHHSTPAPPNPPEHATHRQQGTEPTGGKRMRVTRGPRGEGGGSREGVDSAWISHVSMEQGTLMSTYLRWLGSTHL